MQTYNTMLDVLKTTLDLDKWSQARKDLAAMALCHIESKQYSDGVDQYYIVALEYTPTEALEASRSNRAAFHYMIGNGFKTSEIIALGTSC